jgi:septal ring factor EnvC (AmiA/AmiB activator)
MCKKLGVTALVIVAALFVLHKLDLDKYAKAWLTRTRAELKDQISPEQKIEVLRQQIAELTPELKKQRTAIAKESTQIDVLKEEIAKAKANLKEREEKLALLREALKSDTAFITTDGDRVPKEKLEAVFSHKFAEFQAAEAAVKAKEELLSRRKEKLEVALTHLRTMESKQKEWQSKVELMDIELAKLRESQMQNNLAVDDSKFSEVSQLFDEVNVQIATQKKQLEMERAADVDAAVEKAVEQKAQAKKAVEQWDERANGKTAAKVSKKD